MDWSNEYYHDTGITMVVSAKERIRIRELLSHEACKTCGGELDLYVACDSCCVICSENMGHSTGWCLDMDSPRFKEMAVLIKI
jgi:hypothetical protein